MLKGSTPILTVRTEACQYLRDIATRMGISQAQLLQRALDAMVQQRDVERVLAGLVGVGPNIPVVRLEDVDRDIVLVDVADTVVQKPSTVLSGQRFTARPQLQHTRGPGTFVHAKRQPISKEQMRRDLEQAVVNTGGKRMNKEDRKARLVILARTRGRFCPSDLGGQEEQQRWLSALKELTDEGTLHKNDPEPRTRRVYYQLSPSSVSVPPSPDASKDDCAAPLLQSEGADARMDVPMFLSWARDVDIT